MPVKRGRVSQRGIPYHVIHPMVHSILPNLPIQPLPHPREQTDANENITFPKLRLRSVTIVLRKVPYVKAAGIFGK